MTCVAVVLTIVTQAIPHGARSVSSFAAVSSLLETSVVANAQGAPASSGSLDGLVSQTERILSMAQASKNAVRIAEATNALQNLKALRDGTAPPPADTLHGNRGPASEFGIAMSHIAAQAATSKLQPVLDIMSEMGGPVLMDHIDAYVRANAAFEAARNASAPSTSRLEQAANDTRLKIMSDFSRLATNPAALRSAASGRAASSPTGTGLKPADAAATDVPATGAAAATFSTPGLDDFQRTLPSNPGASRALSYIKRVLAVEGMIKNGKSADEIMKALSDLGAELNKLPTNSTSRDAVTLARAKAVEQYGEVYRIVQASAVRSGGKNAILPRERGFFLSQLQFLMHGDRKVWPGLEGLVLAELDASQPGSGASLKQPLLTAVKSSEP